LQVDGYDSAGTCHVGCVEYNKFLEDCSVRASKESGWEEDSVEMDIEVMLNSTQLLSIELEGLRALIHLFNNFLTLRYAYFFLKIVRLSILL
jgi:hypothetical protein